MSDVKPDDWEFVATVQFNNDVDLRLTLEGAAEMLRSSDPNGRSTGEGIVRICIRSLEQSSREYSEAEQHLNRKKP